MSNQVPDPLTAADWLFTLRFTGQTDLYLNPKWPRWVEAGILTDLMPPDTIRRLEARRVALRNRDNPIYHCHQ